MKIFGTGTELFLYFSNTEVLAMSVIPVALLLTVVKVALGGFVLN